MRHDTDWQARLRPTPERLAAGVALLVVAHVTVNYTLYAMQPQVLDTLGLPFPVYRGGVPTAYYPFAALANLAVWYVAGALGLDWLRQRYGGDTA